MNYVLTTVLYSVLVGNFAAVFSIDKSIDELSGIWFLWSVLACSMVVGIACKVSNNKYIQILLLIIGTLFVAMFPNSSMNIYMYPYFVIGFVFAGFPESKIKEVIIKGRYISLVLFPTLVMFYQKEHFIYTSGLHITQYNNIELLSIDMFRWLIGLVGSIFAVTVVELIFNVVYRYNKESKVLTFVSQLGKTSLQIYVLQRIFLESWLKMLYKEIVELIGHNVLTFNMHIYNLVFTPLIAIVYAGGLLILIAFLNRKKVGTLIFGR